MHTDANTRPTDAGRSAGPAQAGRTTRRLLAAAVVAAPALIAINAMFHPEVDLDGASLLAGATADPAAWFRVHVIAAVGALLGVPAAFGLRHLVTHRGRRLADAGLTLTVVAAPVLALTFAAEASVLRLAAAELEPAAALALAEAYARAPEFYAVGASVMLGLVGSLLLGVALLAGQAVPRWQAGTYVAAELVTVAAVPGSVIGPAAFAVITLVSSFIAIRIVRDEPARWGDR